MDYNLKGFKFINNAGKTVIMSLKSGTELKAQDYLESGKIIVYTISDMCQLNNGTKLTVSVRYQDDQQEAGCEIIYDQTSYIYAEDTIITATTENGKISVKCECAVKKYHKIAATNHAAVIAVFKIYDMDGNKAADSGNKTVGKSWSIELSDKFSPNTRFKVGCDVKAGKDPSPVYGYYAADSEAALNLELTGTTGSNHLNII